MAASPGRRHLVVNAATRRRHLAAAARRWCRTVGEGEGASPLSLSVHPQLCSASAAGPPSSCVSPHRYRSQHRLDAPPRQPQPRRFNAGIGLCKWPSCRCLVYAIPSSPRKLELAVESPRLPSWPRRRRRSPRIPSALKLRSYTPFYVFC